LVDEARAGAETSASPQRLAKVLESLSTEEIQEFGHKFREKLCDLNHWNLWGAGYVIAGGMSDDSFHYFRSWIIGKGKHAFDLALKSPDDLAPLIDNNGVNNELLEYVAMKALQKKGIKERPRDRADRSPDNEPIGEPFDEDTVAQHFPKLAARSK
jgi:hypothetical protein